MENPTDNTTTPLKIQTPSQGITAPSYARKMATNMKQSSHEDGGSVILNDNGSSQIRNA